MVGLDRSKRRTADPGDRLCGFAARGRAGRAGCSHQLTAAAHITAGRIGLASRERPADRAFDVHYADVAPDGPMTLPGDRTLQDGDPAPERLNKYRLLAP